MSKTDCTTGDISMSMTIDELVDQAIQLSPIAQDELVYRLLTLRRKRISHVLLPPPVSGKVWLEHWHEVNIDPDVADEMLRAIEEQCERIDPNDWQLSV